MCRNRSARSEDQRHSGNKPTDRLIDFQDGSVGDAGNVGGIVNPSHFSDEEPPTNENESAVLSSPTSSKELWLATSAVGCKHSLDSLGSPPRSPRSDDTHSPITGPRDGEQWKVDGNFTIPSSMSGGVRELNPLSNVLSNDELLLFATEPVPPQKTYECSIVRDKRGLDKSFYPTYHVRLQSKSTCPRTLGDQFLQGIVDNAEQQELANRKPSLIPSSPTIGLSSSPSLETPPKPPNSNESSPSNRRQVFIFSGRRRKKSKTYLISTDSIDISRDNCVAKLKSNVLGTMFNGIRIKANGERFEIATIIYETNVLGFKGPRKMTVLLPKNAEVRLLIQNFRFFANEPFQMCKSPSMSLLEYWKSLSKSIYQLKNKAPIWNEGACKRGSRL